MPRSQTDKRDRLIQTAVALVYENGFRSTTLAQIANHARVPLGTVYYFFKTKEALGEALVERYLSEYRERCRQWDQHADPKERLESFLGFMVEATPQLAKGGCRIGSLCGELHKQAGSLAERATSIFGELLVWLTTQFRALGKESDSNDLAVHLLSAVEGAALLTQSFHNPKYFVSEASRLKDWIRSI